jgi:hypothetical protein
MISSFAESDFAEFVRRSRSVLFATILLLAILTFVIRLSPGAFSYFDFSNMVGSGASLELAAMGQALVVLTGGFDLSAGAVVSLTNVVVASAMGDSVSSQVGVALLALAIGGAVGAVTASSSPSCGCSRSSSRCRLCSWSRNWRCSFAERQAGRCRRASPMCSRARRSPIWFLRPSW